MATITPLNSSSIYDEKVIRELFEQHYTPLVLFAKGYIPDLDTDKDVVQEVFLSLIESQETFNDVDNLKAYLYGTVRHKCLKYLRHEEVKRRYQKYMQSEAPDETKTYEERVLEEVRSIPVSLPPIGADAIRPCSCKYCKHLRSQFAC